jgi:hypothetical protein
MRPDGVVLQIGVANRQVANALRKHWPTMRHVMVEADITNARNFGAVQAALSGSEGPTTLWLGKKAYEHSTFGRPASCIGSETVRGLTLAAILDELGLTEVDLLLCNCEGAELHAIIQLAGSVGARVRQACMALHCLHVQHYSRQMLDAALVPLKGQWETERRMPNGLEYRLFVRNLEIKR